MKLKATILGLLLASACAHASAPGWEVEVLGHEAWAKGDKLRLPLIRSGMGEPEILSWEQPEGAGPAIRLLRYVAGEQGTSEKMLELRGLVYHTGQKKVLANETLAYVDPDDKGRKTGAQPDWVWTLKSLVITTLDKEEPLRIPLGP
jgi:hypothetical protein